MLVMDRVEFELQCRKTDFVVMFNLDCSGSMSGSSWRNLVKAVSTFVDSFSDDTVLGAKVFNNNVKDIYH
jgi:hypothetical protein